MAEDDPKRMDEIRKYAAIYGRFDCKRKPEKPLTLHEVRTINFDFFFYYKRKLTIYTRIKRKRK